MGDSDSGSDFTVAVFSDLHSNRPYKVGGKRSANTRLGNGNAQGFLGLPHTVDAVISAGDFFDASTARRKAEMLNDTEKAGLENRFHPEALIEQLLQANPKVQYHFAVGNHEGDSALNAASPVIKYFKHLESTHPNFQFADNIRMGNMMVLHGHSFIQDVRYGGRDGKGYDVGEILSPYATVSAEDNAGLAKAMCQTVPTIRSFIQEQTAHLPKDGKAEVYIFFAHTHRWFDETVAYPDDSRVTVHVSNLGCMLPHSKANYKLIHFDHNHVSKVETLDLHKIQR